MPGRESIPLARQNFAATAWLMLVSPLTTLFWSNSARSAAAPVPSGANIGEQLLAKRAVTLTARPLVPMLGALNSEVELTAQRVSPCDTSRP